MNISANAFTVLEENSYLEDLVLQKLSRKDNLHGEVPPVEILDLDSRACNCHHVNCGTPMLGLVAPQLSYPRSIKSI